MNKYIFLLILTLTSSSHPHRIIYLISPPRSLSVAFLRMMDAREDFQIMHEPSQHAWVLSKGKDHEYATDWFLAEASQSFADVKSQILAKAQQGNVFIKEMSFAIKNFLITDPEWIRNSNIHFVFLLRNPHHSSISFYNKVKHFYGTLSAKEKHDFIDILGYQACYEIFQAVKANSPNKPTIIFSEDLYQYPEETVRTFCHHLDIPFSKECFKWDSLSDDFCGYKEWHKIKHKEHIHHWHGEAIKSSGFKKPTQYLVDEYGGPTFAEISNEKDHDDWIHIYEQNLIFYNLLLSEKTYLLSK